MFAEALGIAGASVCTPFGQEALAAAVRADDVARKAGAVNAVRRTPDGWEATNTSAAGGNLRRPTAASQAGEDRVVAEAEQQWEWWTGRRPQPGVMRVAALAETGHRDSEAQSRT